MCTFVALYIYSGYSLVFMMIILLKILSYFLEEKGKEVFSISTTRMNSDEKYEQLFIFFNIRKSENFWYNSENCIEMYLRVHEISAHRKRNISVLKGVIYKQFFFLLNL